MGCLCPQGLPDHPPTPPINNSKGVKFSNIQQPILHVYDADPNNEPLQAPPRPPPPLRPLPRPRPQNDQSRVLLHTPIYIAKQSYEKTNDDQISFENDDEMELIEEINPNELRVNHLRSGLSGIVLQKYVQIDVDTPLRLAVQQFGVIQRCLVHNNVPGGYLIRRSANVPNSFVLSILQSNEHHQTLTWNYLICIHSSNKCFYFHQEDKLKTIFFSSFRQLVADQRVHAVIPLTETVPSVIEFDKEVWNIPYNELKMDQKIGEGQFGEVFRATWHRGRQDIPVAIKKLRIRGITSTVQRQIEAMQVLTNLYIVTLYGVSENPRTNEILIITELMENGDLRTWLKNLPNLPEYSTLVRFAKDIARGMSYLELCNYVHRDLACRNILVGPCARPVRIADFGLSTILNPADEGQRQEARLDKLATRWLAPELLGDQADYSLKSDVWSFGILLIELWQKGRDPYENEHRAWIQGAVKTGYVHEKPTDCPDDFYQSIICQCLKFESNDRPTFSAIRTLLETWQCS